MFTLRPTLEQKLLMEQHLFCLTGCLYFCIPTGMHILLDLNPKLHFHQRFYAFICLYFRSIPTSSLNYLLSLKTLGFALRFLFALLCFSLSFCLIKFCCYRYMCICQLLCCCWVKLVAKSVVHQPQQELARKHSPADSQ